MSQTEYHQDFYTWTQTQAQALRAKDWAALDIEHLAEEIDSLGRSERFAIERQMERLLWHLLKWRDDPAVRPRRGWRLTLLDARGEIAKRATGGLREYPAASLPEAYRRARRKAAVAMARPLADFPEQCPWPLDAVLDDEFLPMA